MVTERGTVDAGRLTDFTTRALEKVGVPGEDASITARIIVEADLRGIDSHGVARFGGFYIRRLLDGLINKNPRFKFISNAPSTAIMDADRGLGFVVGYRAMEDAMDRAEKTGAGFVSVRNSTHFGAGAYYSMMALPRDMIGISMTQGGLGVVAPGSRGRGLGLNVISVAVPAKDEIPFVLDMCTAVVAHGKLEIAERNEKPIPEGWALDDDGNPTTNVARATGGILPLGGRIETGAWKGFGLTVLVDILCSTISGVLTHPEIELGTNPPGYANQFFGALRIDGFMPVDQFKENMDAMIRAHHRLPKAPGTERITLAGQIEYETRQERLSHGIPLHPRVLASLKEVAEELDIEYNL